MSPAPDSTFDRSVSHLCYANAINDVSHCFVPRDAGDAKGTRIKAIMRSVKDILTLWFKWIVLGKAGRRTLGKVIRLDPTESE